MTQAIVHKAVAQGVPQRRREDGQRTPFLGPENTPHSDGSEDLARKEMVNSEDAAGEDGKDTL